MGGKESGTGEEPDELLVSREFKGRPAIAIVASGSNFGAVTRTLLDANRNGFFVIVAVFESTDPAIIELCRRLELGVLELDVSTATDAYDSIEKAARSFGFSGVLFYEPSDRYIDFDRCDAAVRESDSYGTEAPTVNDSEGVIEVLAAIPAYNEASTIGQVVREVREYADRVLIVDDGSSDETAIEARRAGATVIEHERNGGYGEALKTAFEEADRLDADVLVTVDGDGQHPSKKIPELVETCYETDANVVIGSRFTGDVELHVPLYRRFGLGVINVLTNLSMGTIERDAWISDTQSGFRIYDRAAIESLTGDPHIANDMSASTDILYHVVDRGYRIEEVGTPIRYDGDATSSQNPISHGLTVIGNILRTVERKRPLTFLGIPGVFTVLFGFGFGYLTLFNYLENQTISGGLALLCLLCLFTGTLLSVASVILHSFNTHMETLADRGIQRG